MESHLYTQWVQSPIPDPAHQPQQQLVGGHAAAANDWTKDRSQQQQVAGGALGVQSPTMGSQALDHIDFTTLSDLPASNPLTSTQGFYNAYGPNFFLSHSPFNALPYGTPWPAATALPLSSYSSLNGATTSSSTQSSTQSTSQPQSLQQQQHSPAMQHQPHPQQQSAPGQLMIDPALTLSGNSHNTQPSYSQSPTYPTQQAQQQQLPQQHNAQMQQRIHSFTQPTMMYTPSPYYRPQTQQTQGTLSPQALHSPMMPMMQTSFFAQPQSMPQTLSQAMSVASPIASTSQQTVMFPGSASASASGTPPALSPEEKEDRKRKFTASLRPLLQSTAFSGAQAVQHLTDRIADYGATEVDAPTRLEILARIRDGAGNHYYRAWSENPIAIDITREWIKAATKNDSGSLEETIMPLLHLIDRLPFNVESLKDSKLGKIILKLGKDRPPSAIKDLASNLERRWRLLIENADNGNEATRKRKSSELSTAAIAKAMGPQKKVAVGTATSTKPVIVKREVKPLVAAPQVKDAKADSSFFSAPKPKAKLPSFKKAPPPVVKREESASIAQPSNFDPFKEALKSMKVGRKGSPAVSTPPPQSAASSTASDTLNHMGLAKNLKKRKSVTWAPDSQLESVKFIEKAIYDDDPVDGAHIGHSLRDLDRGEGAAMHTHIFEETIDWSEPSLIDLPPDPEHGPARLPRGHGSQERDTQEAREQTALSAVYMTPSQIPDSAAEPTTIISEEEADKNVTHMLVGEEMDALLYGAEDMMVDANLNVGHLVGQLSSAFGGGANGSTMMDTSSSGATPSLDLSSIQNLPQAQLQSLLAQLGAYGTDTSGGVSASGTDAGWGSGGYDYGQQQGGYHDESEKAPRWEDGGRDSRGRGGGRGRGRGRGGDWGGKPYLKRRPCTFFQQQRCKYGDQCDFLHELVPPGERMD